MDSWSRADGLPLNSVYSITQTPDGFLWFGTQAGLVRFDGTEFRVFHGGDGSGLVGDILHRVAVDQQGRLLVGGLRGLFREVAAGRFQRVSLGTTPQENQVINFWMTPDGTGWGNRTTGGFRLQQGKVESLGERYVRRVGASPDGRRAFVSFPQGMVEITASGERPVRDLGRNAPAQPSAATEDEKGRVWLAAADGLWKLEAGEFVRVLEAKLPPVIQLLVDRAGNLWMVFGPSGGARYDVERGSLEQLGGVLAHAQISCCKQDRDGNIWFGTENDGVWRLREGTFTTLGATEGLPHPMVNALAETPDGTFYAATDDGGLYWQRGRESGSYGVEQGLANPAIGALTVGPDGALWLGLLDGTVQVLREGKFTTYGAAAGLPPSVVTQLRFDGDNRLWVGHNSGGIWRQEADGRFVPLAGEPGAPQGLVSLLHSDRAGTLWIGVGSGLVQRANGKFERLAAGLPEAMISALCERQPGELWLGTDQAGLGRWRDGKFKSFPVEGLPRPIFALAMDEAERLWISSNDGVSCVAFADLEAWERGERDNVPRIHFGLKDGLRTLEGRAVYGPTVLRTSDGLIRFATGKGVATVDPRAVTAGRQPAAVWVNGVTVDGTPWPATPGLVLVPGWKTLRFNYSALELAAPERLIFDTWLEGYEPGWIEAGRRREAVYTNLSPGNYVLHVRARRTDGVGRGVETKLAFVVRPRFHQTAWFLVLGFAGAGLALAGVYRLRLRASRERQAWLEQMVAARTHDLQVTTVELAKANVAKNRIMAVIGHDLRGPAGSLRGLTQILEKDPRAFSPEELQDVARHIDVACGAQIELLNNLLEWSRVQAGELALHPESLPAGRPVAMTVELLAITAREKQIALRQVVGVPVGVLADENSVYTILRNLVGNAIKFTRAGGTVSISVVAAGREVCYTVEDTGVGLSPEQLQRLLGGADVKPSYGTNAERGTGLGWSLSRDLARLNGGRLTMTSVEGQGTRVMLWLPAAAPA